MRGLPPSPALSPTVREKSHHYVRMLKDKSALATLKWWASLLLDVRLLLPSAKWACSARVSALFFQTITPEPRPPWVSFSGPLKLFFFLQEEHLQQKSRGALHTWHRVGEWVLNPSQQGRPVSLGKALCIWFLSKVGVSCCTAFFLYAKSLWICP